MEELHIKDLWQQDKDDAVPQISLEQKRKFHLPLEKIRSNMKLEFWTTLLTYPLLIIGLFPLIKDTHHILSGILLVIIGTSVTGYYFFKFYKFYKRLGSQHLSTINHFINLRYELLMNRELYKSYYVAFVPIAYAAFLVVNHQQNNFFLNIYIILISFLFSVTIMYFVGRVWLKELYGKYILQISDLIDELDPQHELVDFNRKSLESSFVFKPADQTKIFFSKQFGEKSGGVINTIFWWATGFIVLMIFSVLLGYGIGYGAAKLNIITPDDLKNLKPFYQK